jgi:hypothetical protein
MKSSISQIKNSVEEEEQDGGLEASSVHLTPQVRRIRVINEILYFKGKKSIGNHKRDDKTAENQRETGTEKSRKPSTAPILAPHGGWGSQNHNHKVSQANLVTTDWHN